MLAKRNVSSICMSVTDGCSQWAGGSGFQTNPPELLIASCRPCETLSIVTRPWSGTAWLGPDPRLNRSSTPPMPAPPDCRLRLLMGPRGLESRRMGAETTLAGTDEPAIDRTSIVLWAGAVG